MDKTTREALEMAYSVIKELLAENEPDTEENSPVKLGTLRVLGHPMPEPQKPYYGGDILGYNGEDFTIGDTVPGNELTWLPLGNLLVCDRNILQGISWNTLDKKGFVFGKKIEIDDALYKLRILTGSDGSKYGAGSGNEWDQLIDTYKEDNELLHFADIYSWCQEKDHMFASCRSVRGYKPARFYNRYAPTTAETDIGWRPVLERITPAP